MSNQGVISALVGAAIISIIAPFTIIAICKYFYSQGKKKYGKEWVYRDKSTTKGLIVFGSTFVISIVMLGMIGLCILVFK